MKLTITSSALKLGVTCITFLQVLAAAKIPSITSTIPCCLLPANTLSTLGMIACSHQRKKQQIYKHPCPKIQGNHPKNTRSYPCIAVSLQVYFGFPKLTEKEKHGQGEELWRLRDIEFKREVVEILKKMKADYQGVKSR